MSALGNNVRRYAPAHIEQPIEAGGGAGADGRAEAGGKVGANGQTEADGRARASNGTEAGNRLHGGSRRIVLSDPAFTQYMSEGLTDITGYTQQDLDELFDSQFERIIHPDDLAAFRTFDEELRAEETTVTLRYRIVCKDGSIVQVRDTMNSHRIEDGSLIGYSLIFVIDDAPAAAEPHAAVDAPAKFALDGGSPSDIEFGVLYFEGDGNVVTSANEQALAMLGRTGGKKPETLGKQESGEGVDSTPDAIGKPLLSLVPSIDHAAFLERVPEALPEGGPITFDMHFWHSEGYLIEVTVWLRCLTETATGKRAYRLAFIDVTRNRSRERASRRKLRVSYFETIYDCLFLLDVRQQRAVCYKCDLDLPFVADAGTKLSVDEVVNPLVDTLPRDDARASLEAFFAPLLRKRDDVNGSVESDGGVPSGDVPNATNPVGGALTRRPHEIDPLAHKALRIDFAPKDDDAPFDYEFVLIDAEAQAYFLGCRTVELGPNSRRRRRTDDGKAEQAEHTQHAGDPFSDRYDMAAGALRVTAPAIPPEAFLALAPSPDRGALIFSVEGGRVHVLFANERGREAFGDAGLQAYSMTPSTLVDALPDAFTRASIDELLDKRELRLDDVAMPNGLASWRAVLLRESKDSTREIALAYEIDDPEAIVAARANLQPGQTDRPSAHGNSAPDQPSVFVRTFGYFDVFVDGEAVAFSSDKAKELLALLVDRRGGFVTANEAISCLWENEAATSVVLARQRKVAMRLKNILDASGIGHIVKTEKGKRRLNTSCVSCDLYDYLAGKEHATFPGIYLQNYSWGETTLGELLSTMPFHR